MSRSGASASFDVTFDARIGVEVKGDTWNCVEVPDSVRLLGTRTAVRVDAAVDGIPLPNVGLMVTGTGGHMLSLSAKLRGRLSKEIGDVVTVRLRSRAAE